MIKISFILVEGTIYIISCWKWSNGAWRTSNHSIAEREELSAKWCPVFLAELTKIKRDNGIAYIDTLDKIRYQFPLAPPDKNKAHSDIAKDVADSMLGIGGVPTAQEFYDEFNWRLKAALKLL